MGLSGFMIMAAMCGWAWLSFIATLRVIFAACRVSAWPDADTLE